MENNKYIASWRIDAIQYAEKQNLNFHSGDAVWHITKAQHKDKEEAILDLEQAKWHIEREIERLKSENKEKKSLADYTQNLVGHKHTASIADHGFFSRNTGDGLVIAYGADLPNPGLMS